MRKIQIAEKNLSQDLHLLSLLRIYNFPQVAAPVAVGAPVAKVYAAPAPVAVAAPVARYTLPAAHVGVAHPWG